MRVCGDNFAVASEQGLYISVWNWKSGEHISDFVCSLFEIKWNPILLTKSQTASLQASVFAFLDEYHILFPSSIDDGLYVYDIRAMPPINTRKKKLKGTHCFEISILQFWGNGTVCNIILESNSLATGIDVATDFYTSPHDRMISLRFTAVNSTNMRSSWGEDYREIHVHARALLMWTQAHSAPPNACVTVPWSAWSASAARVVAPRKDGSDGMYIHPPRPRFSGCGMRIISVASVQSGGTTGVSIADYHPARVFRGFKKEVVRHTHVSQAKAEVGLRSKYAVVYAGRNYPSVNNATYYGTRSECPPLTRVRALFFPFSFLTFYFAISVLRPALHPFCIYSGSDEKSIHAWMVRSSTGAREGAYHASATKISEKEDAVS